MENIEVEMESAGLEIKMPGKIFDGDGKTFWRHKADKVKYQDRSGNRLGYVIESRDQHRLFRKLAGQYSCYALWQALKASMSIETGLVHITQVELAGLSQMRAAQVSKAMSVLKDVDLVRKLFACDECRSPGLALDPELVMIGDHARARRLWNLAKSQSSSARRKENYPQPRF